MPPVCTQPGVGASLSGPLVNAEYTKSPVFFRGRKVPGQRDHVCFDCRSRAVAHARRNRHLLGGRGAGFADPRSPSIRNIRLHRVAQRVHGCRPARMPGRVDPVCVESGTCPFREQRSDRRALRGAETGGGHCCQCHQLFHRAVGPCSIGDVAAVHAVRCAHACQRAAGGCRRDPPPSCLPSRTSVR